MKNTEQASTSAQATTYQYRKLQGLPEAELLQRIARLHESIFADPQDVGLIQKIHNNVTIQDMDQLLTIVALDGDQVVGYKIGYPLMEDEHTFYSWLGGVNPAYRQQGIASRLMDEQHEHLREQGYRKVQTKTMNRWRNMLLLNIQYGFDIVDTFTDARGMFKIVLEKELM
ncbi:GNAT family N-acetyltransferase [Paenibacillus hunanensis]|uniref:GNAT family N-acetyltransferase n=1 Tax=Paenibacillus hunanensis TaxID=539262 RepID=UPI00202639DB|nr:GNAT family N-acetyltransferase [Paenibacillus hunanensis]MCL9662636.1 GNAT family N-acetyltransferase [Paenibacillus hunanensis]